jgi:SAM-dependent methyltransferase
MSAAAWSLAHRVTEAARVDTTLRSACGRVIALPSARWWEESVDEEQRVLDLAIGPALDLGCGPGRHTVALARRGVRVLGVDSSAAAVAAARGRGASVMHRSVFDPLPDEGRWGSALLLDGNVGIGGDPQRLFRRTRDLLRPGGRTLIEVEAPGQPTESLRVRAEIPGGSTGWFPWARVGVDASRDLAMTTGFRLVSTWSDGGRWFARLDAR